MKKLQLPYGVQDYLPEKCYCKNEVERQLSKVFYQNGYEKVATPALEYYDLYGDISQRQNLKKMFKMTDNDGSLLVLRPDVTVQILRMAATSLNKDKINRLYYVSDSFEYLRESSTSRSREFSQVGIELLGTNDIGSDIETVLLAIESLLSTGLDDFLIDIGHVDFFLGIMEDAGLNESQVSELKTYVNSKDLLGTELFIEKLNVSGSIAKTLSVLPSLFGDEEILLTAKKLIKTSNVKSLNALDRLQKILKAVSAAGYKKYVSVDLGLLSGDYYSGIVMRGMTKSLGVAILEGGRYDNLATRFQKDMAAIGFSIGVNRVMTALETENKTLKLPVIDVAYIVKGEYSAFEKECVDKFLSNGERAVKLIALDEKSAVQYVKTNEIKKLFLIDNNAKKIKELGI